jgi:hypothetical protein
VRNPPWRCVRASHGPATKATLIRLARAEAHRASRPQAGCARRPASPPRRRGRGPRRLMPDPQPATARNRAPGWSMPTQAAARSRSRFAYAACVRRCRTSRSTLFCLHQFRQASGHSSPECRGEACPFQMPCPHAAKRQRVRVCGPGRTGDLWPASQSVQPGRRKRSTICVLCRTPGSPRNPLKFGHHNADDRCHGRTLRRRYDNPRKYNGLRPATKRPWPVAT